MEEIKLTEPELKELNRKVASITEAMIVVNTLERDKGAYLTDVVKSHPELDSAKVYNVDLKTGVLTEQVKPIVSVAARPEGAPAEEAEKKSETSPAG